MPVLIAISGKQGSGKTTAADYLVKNFKFKRISFSDKIKEIAIDLFGISYDQAYGQEKNRELLQKIGFHMREIDEDVWIKYLIRNIDRSKDTIIDDMRMKTEFNALKSLGFMMIKIETDKEIRKTRIPYYFNEDDITEVNLDDISGWDSIIDNNKQKPHLYYQMDNLVSKFRKE